MSFEFRKGFSEVKDVSVFGVLNSPDITSFELLALYRYNATEKLILTEMLALQE